MPLNDILLQIDTYPDATSAAAIDQAVAFAAAVQGRISALAVQVDIPDVSNRVADYLIGLSQLAADEEARSREAALSSLEHFKAAAEAAGVFGAVLGAREQLYRVGDAAARLARTHDLSLVPYGQRLDSQRAVAEAMIFDSGRPVLVYRAGDCDLPAGGVETVVIAWDGGRAAARAVGDALPVLQKARRVRVLTVLHEKPSAEAGCAHDLLRHLKAHGIDAGVDEVDGKGRRIGEVLDAYLKQAEARLLVMGAYGRSRVREFVLGGATEHVLHGPVVPVLLSH